MLGWAVRMLVGRRVKLSILYLRCKKIIGLF